MRRVVAWVALGTLAAVGGAALLGWWRGARIEPLFLVMGASFADVQARFGAPIGARVIAAHSYAEVTRPHRVTLELPGGPYELPPTRFTALDFTDHRLHRVLTNPHDEVLSLRAARTLALRIGDDLRSRGWKAYRTRFPDDAWVEGLRREGAQRPVRDLAYFERSPIVVGLTLKLHHWRGAPIAAAARVAPGLAFLMGAFADREAADGWLVDVDVVATDRTPPDHVTLQRFARFTEASRRLSWPR